MDSPADSWSVQRGSSRVRPVKRACVDCHARKVRCDGALNGFPCSNCRTAGVSCTVAERRKRRCTSGQQDPSTHPQETSTRARAGARVRTGTSTITVQSHTSNTAVDPVEPTLVDDDGNPATGPRWGPERRSTHVSASRLRRATWAPESGSVTPGNGDEDGLVNDNVDEAGSGGVTAADYAGEYELAKQHLVDFFSQDLQDNPIRARSTYVGSELSNLNYLTLQRAANQHVHHYPCSNIHVPREFRNSTQTLATPNLIPKDAFVLPPRHVSDILVADYFAHVHPGFPVIDRDAFLAAYHDATSTSTSAPPILLLQAVCLAGSHVTKTYKNTQDLKVAFFRRAKALLDGRYEEDRMNVVQAALLLTWFSDGGDDICANAWWWIGLAARTAIGLGMHREVGPSKMPDNDKRIWRMIWWCLVQFDCLVSLCYGRPQNINLDDCDVAPLHPGDFDSSASPGDADVVMHHVKLCSIISDLVRTHYSVRATKSGTDRRDALTAVDEALAEWLIGLPPDLRQQGPRKPTSTAGGPEQPWRLLMHLTYNAVLIQFHRPLANSVVASGGAPGRNAFGDEEIICEEAASIIIRIFEQLGQGSGLRHCWFSAPSALFTAMLQVSGQLRCANPILALRSKERHDSGLRSLRRLARHWLFAASVLRLFESNSIRSSQRLSENNNNNNNNDSATRQVISPDEEHESPLVTVSSVGAVSTSDTGPPPVAAMNPDHAHLPQSQHQGMDWVQLLGYGDPNAGNMHVESNRWQHSVEEWQSLYWSDPLSNIRLEDNFGQFQHEWQ